MYAGHTVGVVVPAYNEERFVEEVIRDIPSYVDRIYVVDDASTDGTWNEILAATNSTPLRRVHRHEKAERGANGGRTVTRGDQVRGTTETPGEQDATAGSDQFEESPSLESEWDLESIAETADSVHSAFANRTDEIVLRGRVVAISHRTNRGAGGAIKTGYLAALVDRVDAVATIDADGQMDPLILSSLLDPIVEGDIGYVKGNRLIHEEYRDEIPPFRLVGNGILTFLTKIASGYWRVMDPQNGYTVISREAPKVSNIEYMYEGYGYLNDLLIKLNVSDIRIADVPTTVEYSEEESHIQYSSYIPKVSLLLLTGFLWRLKIKYLVVDFHPLVFFYFSGTIITSISTSQSILG
jgi:glycosyltransferase involved in cell wall biosynthesis